MVRHPFRKCGRLAVSAAALALAGLPASVGSQATVQSISRQDKQEGAKAHPQLVAEFGGAVTGPQASYVESVGKNIAVQSGLSNARGDFTVTLLNSPVNNAFAIPGGYVYVTRQLVALMNDEAELAGVLGHEVAHVAARHAAKRQSAASRNAVIGALGSILSGVLLGDTAMAQMGQKLFSQGSQLLTLRYSRGQETEADNLGITYLRRAGYDPRAMSSVLQSLADQNALEAQLTGSANRTPEWASTHPDPASRVRAAMARAGESTGGTTNRDTFLTRISGLTYGDDPKQGIVDGLTFIHPALRLRFQAPNGYYMVNGARSVSINGQAGKAEFSTGQYNGDMSAYIGRVFSALTKGQQSVSPESIERTTVNGLPAAYAAARAQTNSGQVDVIVFAYEFARDQAYHFVAIAPAGRAGLFDDMFGSMRRIGGAEAGAVRARKLQVVTVRPGETVQSLASRMAYDRSQLERFLVLNGLGNDARLAAGQKVKIVTY